MMRFLLSFVMTSALFGQSSNVIALPGKSPLVTLRIVFLTGAASDPAGKPGLANLTASMLSRGGTKDLTYKQIVDAMFPMATGVASQVDKEMITFAGATHVDNLEAFYKLFRAMIFEPGWREDDFKRVKDDTINYLRVELRGNNDEELGKEVLYNEIYRGHPYGHENAGTVSALQEMTLADLQQFYSNQLLRSGRFIALAGGYPPEFLARLQKDFGKISDGELNLQKLPAPQPIETTQLTIVEKDTRSVAYSLGFPIDVRRGDPDYPALLVAQAYFGQHRTSGGRLFDRMRQLRGLNYGDYSYIEYFPRGMFLFEPSPNLARRQQIFQIWIRPVEPPNAHFALRLALCELDKLVKGGLTQEQFERTRAFLSKYVNLLTKTKMAELGYAIDSRFYGIPDYNSYIKTALAKLTLADVNKAIAKHLRVDKLQIVAVAKDAGQLGKQLLSDAPSPITYNSPKPEDILEEDKIVASWKLRLKEEAVRISPVEKVFE